MICLILAAAAAFQPDLRDPRQRMLSALAQELDRAHDNLRLRGHEAPYFVSYAVRGIDTDEVGGKYGAVFLEHHRHERRLHVDVSADDVTYTLRDGDATLTLLHHGEPVEVTTDKPATLAIPPTQTHTRPSQPKGRAPQRRHPDIAR